MLDPFLSLGLERTFDLDREAIEAAYLNRMRDAHPDRVTRDGAPERHRAEVEAAALAQARRLLLDPCARSRSLLGLSEGESPAPVSPAFLEWVLAQREALAALRLQGSPSPGLLSLTDRLARAWEQGKAALAAAHRGGDRLAACQALAELRFHDRLQEEARSIAEVLDP